MNLFKSDVKRAVISLPFWIAVITYMVVAIYVYFSQKDFYTGNIAKPGALNMYLISTVFANNPSLFFVAPFVAIFPFSMSYFEDVKNGYIKSVLSRISVFSYINNRLLSIAVVGGLVLLVSNLLLVLLFFLVDPVTLSYRIVVPNTAFYNIYAQSLLLYICCYLIYLFLFGCTFSLMAAGISSLTNNKYISLCTPIIINNYIYIFAFILPDISKYKILNIIPRNTFSLLNKTIPEILIYNIVIIVISIVIYQIGLYRRRRCHRTT